MLMSLSFLSTSWSPSSPGLVAGISLVWLGKGEASFAVLLCLVVVAVVGGKEEMKGDSPNHTHTVLVLFFFCLFFWLETQSTKWTKRDAQGWGVV